MPTQALWVPSVRSSILRGISTVFEKKNTEPGVRNHPSEKRCAHKQNKVTGVCRREDAAGTRPARGDAPRAVSGPARTQLDWPVGRCHLMNDGLRQDSFFLRRRSTPGWGGVARLRPGEGFATAKTGSPSIQPHGPNAARPAPFSGTQLCDLTAGSGVNTGRVRKGGGVNL